MKPVLILALTAILGLGPALSMAQGNSGHNRNNGNNGNRGHGNKSDRVTIQPVPGPTTRRGCPPGLAKKSCVPPGQVVRNFTRISNPGSWGRAGRFYVQAGGFVYEIDETTHQVLAVIGAVADLLN